MRSVSGRAIVALILILLSTKLASATDPDNRMECSAGAPGVLTGIPFDTLFHEYGDSSGEFAYADTFPRWRRRSHEAASHRCCWA